MSNVGILGIGLHLPDQIRPNDWWPAEVVARWRQRQGGSFASPTGLVAEGATSGLPDGARLIAEAIAAEREDPFQGVRERRIAADGTYASDMETLAARDALANAGTAADEIDFVLSYSTCPDYLMAPNACAVHHKLGLRRDCLSLATEGACNSFLIQLALAEQLLGGGRFRRGLLVQSSMCSRLVPPEQPSSAILGDAATAVVVGAVAGGHGVLGRSHATDGTHFNALAVGVPGRRWYEEGRSVFYAADKDVARKLILSVADRAARRDARCARGRRRQRRSGRVLREPPGDVVVAQGDPDPLGPRPRAHPRHLRLGRQRHGRERALGARRRRARA